ncbi:MAG: response regulator transcription factor [Chloroflexota bacterium]|nr:response regulator transcription factor [Chloroflexota bacterium]
MMNNSPVPVSSPTILVVDDTEYVLSLEKHVLEEAGFTVVTASTGVEALAQAAQRNPDLVLLDVVLPDTDGLTLIQRLREVSKAPIVLVSGKRTAGAEKAEGLQLGADDYITKPFSPGVLVARVRTILKRAGHHIS